MLSDAGSKTITAWGLLNREATGRSAGIPYPGTFVIDRHGLVVTRAFEAAYQERDTAASVLGRVSQAQAGGPRAGSGDPEVRGKHVTVRVSASDKTAAPGQRFTLWLDVTPASKIHVYAPGQTGYSPVEFTLADSADFKHAAAVYPAPRAFFFAPLNETVNVYDGPFRIAQDVTLALTPALRQRATAKETLTIGGGLTYQACDDKVCYLPDRLPLSWSIALVPIER